MSEQLAWYANGSLVFMDEASTVFECPNASYARLIAAAPKLHMSLKHCLGLLCESGDLNNYRNLSDEELGKAWRETAREAAAVLSEVEGKSFSADRVPSRSTKSGTNKTESKVTR